MESLFGLFIHEVGYKSQFFLKLALMTGFVVQGHILYYIILLLWFNYYYSYSFKKVLYFADEHEEIFIFIYLLIDFF